MAIGELSHTLSVTAILPSRSGTISPALVGDCELRIPVYIAVTPAVMKVFTSEISGVSGLDGNDF